MTEPKAYALYIVRPDSSLILSVSDEGVAVFGEGVTFENVWQKIAEAFPVPKVEA